MIAFSLGDLAFFEGNEAGAKVFYAIWVWALFAFLPGSYSCYPATLNAAYGKEHAGSNYGLMFTAQVKIHILIHEAGNCPGP